MAEIALGRGYVELAAVGVEPGPLCNCAVDRVLGGAQRRDAVRQCAAELNVRLPN